MPQVVVPIATWIAGAVSVAGVTVGITGATSAWLTAAVYTVSEIALYAGMQYAVDAISRPKQKQMGYELTFNMDPAYPREMVAGEQLVGGSMVARYSRGSNRNNAHFVIQVADHPCVELSAVLGDGRLVWNSPLTHGARTEITAYSNSGGPRVWMTWHDGRPGQAVDMGLVTASAQDPEVAAGNIAAWTTSHFGAGNAYVHVEVKYDDDILTAIPSWLFKVKGAKFYDRRKDTTAGGSGAHRHDDPSTWEYTTNAAVVWDHWALGYRVEDDELAFGLGLSRVEVPYAQFAAAADLSDEDVDTGTGDGSAIIKRYAVNGVLSSATFFEDQVEDFQLQMAARIVDLGGRIGILGAEERTSVISLSDKDLITGEPLQFAPKLPFSDLYGEVSGNFRDPANNYAATPYTSRRTAYARLPDGGEAQVVGLDFPLEVNARRADRLASAWLARESLQPRMIAVFPSKAWRLEPGDWFDYTDPGLQVENETFEVIDIVRADDFTVTLTARAINPDFLAFDNDNDPDLGEPPSFPPVSLYLDTPSFTPVPTSLVGGGAIEPSITLTLDDYGLGAREILIEIREWNIGAGEFVGPSLYFIAHTDDNTYLLRQGIKADTTYKVRMKARRGGKESTWSEWSDPITTITSYTVPNAAEAERARADSILSRQLDAIEAKAEQAINSFPGFWIIGGPGNVDVEANVTNPSDIKVHAGYISHPILGHVTVEETTFDTAWGELYAPPRGWGGIAWSEEPVDERFANGAGEGHVFAFAYDVDGTIRAYSLDRNAGVAFTPEPTDVVIAYWTKPLQNGSEELSSADGITQCEALLRVDAVMQARLETLEATSGEGSAAITELSIALASEVETRASQTATLTANLGTTNAAVATNATAISTEASARASADSTLTANLGAANASIATNATAIATEAATRASETSTLTANLGTTNANVTTVTSALATETAARVSADSTLTASVGGNSASITAINLLLASPNTSTAIIAMEANAAGVVTGFKIISSNGHSTPISLIEFTAALSKFSGDVIVNGTLTAAKIIGNGITDAGDFEDDSYVGVGASWVDVATTTVTTLDAGTRIVNFCSAYIDSSTDGSVMEARILRGASVIWGPKVIAGDPPVFEFETSETGHMEYIAPFMGMISFFDADVPGAAGTYTYKLQLLVSGSASAPWSATFRRMLSMIFKR